MSNAFQSPSPFAIGVSSTSASVSMAAYARSGKKENTGVHLYHCISPQQEERNDRLISSGLRIFMDYREYSGRERAQRLSAKKVLLPLPPLISPFSLHGKRNQWVTIISLFEPKACDGVNLYFFMNYFYRVRLMDGIVQCLLKSEVVEEDFSIWSNIELVWMESQMIFTTLLLPQQSSVSLDNELGWSRKDNTRKTIL